MFYWKNVKSNTETAVLEYIKITTADIVLKYNGLSWSKLFHKSRIWTLHGIWSKRLKRPMQTAASGEFLFNSDTNWGVYWSFFNQFHRLTALLRLIFGDAVLKKNKQCGWSTAETGEIFNKNESWRVLTYRIKIGENKMGVCSTLPKEKVSYLNF